MSLMFSPEQFQGGLNVFRHNILDVANRARRGRTSLSFRFKFFFTNAVDIVVVGLATVTEFDLKTVALVFASSSYGE
jgi:hypothetical protein